MADSASGGVQSGLGSRSPLWAVLAFSWVSSLGTGLATSGLYFMTTQTYGFSARENYGLALAGGLSYVCGALGAGRLLRLVRARGVSTRGTLIGVLLGLSALSVMPMVVHWMGHDEATLAVAAGKPGPHPASLPHWPMWVLMMLYQPLTGVLWPVVERYLSGGRSGAGLRSALGRWNIVWSSALVVALGLMGVARAGLGENYSPIVLAMLALLHLASILLVWPMGAEPGVHLQDEHEPHPASYRRLLAVFRVLLPTSYLVCTALTPYLPAATARLGLGEAWQSPVGATWTLGRVLTFALLERWHGWHGRRWPAAAAVVLLLGGFGAAVLSPQVGALFRDAGTGPPAEPVISGTIVMMLGLLAFGMGMATIYTAALYYAMECEREDVDAGSRHEALIGVGYMAGPVCGLLASAAVQAGLAPAGSGDVLVFGIVGVVSAGIVWGASRRARSRAGSGGSETERTGADISM